MNTKTSLRLFSVALVIFSCYSFVSCSDDDTSGDEQVEMRSVTVNLTQESTQWDHDKGVILFNEVYAAESYRLTTSSSEESSSATFVGEAPIEIFDLLGFTYPDIGDEYIPSQVRVDLSSQDDSTPIIYAGNAIYDGTDDPIEVTMTKMLMEVKFQLLIDNSMNINPSDISYVTIYSPSLSVIRYLNLTNLSGVEWIGGINGYKITITSEEGFSWSDGDASYDDRFGFNAIFFEGSEAELEIALVNEHGESIYSTTTNLTPTSDFIVVDYTEGKPATDSSVGDVEDGGTLEGFDPTM